MDEQEVMVYDEAVVVVVSALVAGAEDGGGNVMVVDNCNKVPEVLQFCSAALLRPDMPQHSE